MLRNGKSVRLTCQEGNALLLIASNFSLPEKIGDTPYNVADRAISGDEVRELYRELKARSPMMLKPERRILFGPEDNWKETKENGELGHRMTDKTREVGIVLTEASLSGVIWCLIVSLHPASGMVQTVGVQEDIFWPIAEKLKKVRIIKETIGLDPTKATPRRWKDDEEYDEEERVKEAKKAEKAKKEK